MARHELRPEQPLGRVRRLGRSKRQPAENPHGPALDGNENLAPVAQTEPPEHDDPEPIEREPIVRRWVPLRPRAWKREHYHSPDDALGLYLRQMGAIPLLSRAQELALARRLERHRRRYRRAALSNWQTLAHVLDTFERVQAGQLPVDPTIDVVTSLGLSREHILAQMPHNLPRLRDLLAAADLAFPALLRAEAVATQGLRRRVLGKGCASRLAGRGAVAAHRPARPLDRRACAACRGR